MPKTLRHPMMLPIIAFYLYVCGSAPFLGQWDSYDYLKQIVSHQLSALGFGRPVFLGYNILLWESVRSVFHLGPLKVEAVVMTGTVLLGVVGVVLFQHLARHFLPESSSRMAALAFAVSPMYAVYSGFIMTEVPMLVALIASALMVVNSGGRHPVLRMILGGLFCGMAVGIREQAICMAPAFLWLLWTRTDRGTARFQSILLFGSAAGLAILIPVLSFYIIDPAAFIERMRIWLHAIPMGQVQFWNNVQASLLYAMAVCPAAWLCLAAGGYLRRRRRPVPALEPAGELPGSGSSIRNPGWGVFCCIVVPVIALWRDADVQIHPRYLILILPASAIFCSFLYSRWIGSAKSPAVWAWAHVLVFGAAIVLLSPFRQIQTDKMEFAKLVKDSVPGEALMISGSYSPIFDYYRGIGVRPQWQILWSGWDWKPETAEALIRKSWSEGTPVYLSEDSLGWRFFESEYLHFYSFLKNCRKEAVLPRLVRVYPPGMPKNLTTNHTH